jgi:hypothetical protein
VKACQKKNYQAALPSNAGIQPGMKRLLVFTFIALFTASAYAQPYSHRHWRHHHHHRHHHALIVVR